MNVFYPRAKSTKQGNSKYVGNWQSKKKGNGQKQIWNV